MSHTFLVKNSQQISLSWSSHFLDKTGGLPSPTMQAHGLGNFLRWGPCEPTSFPAAITSFYYERQILFEIKSLMHPYHLCGTGDGSASSGRVTDRVELNSLASFFNRTLPVADVKTKTRV